MLALLVAAPSRADETLVLKDGRQIPVTRMVRRDGLVYFETTKGERFTVREDQVVSPPLDSIPAYSAPGAPAAPAAPSPEPTPGPQVLVLKDGRKIPVKRLARRDGQVLIETQKGELFSVPEGNVVSPPLESMPLAPRRPGTAPAPAPSATPPPAPEAPAPQPFPPPAVPEPPAVAPAPAPITPHPLPALTPLGYAGGKTIEPREPVDPTTAEFIPMPDRWRLGFPRYDRYRPKQGMPWIEGSAFDPYNQNLLKADYPIGGNELFYNLNLQNNTNLNPRRVPNGAAQDQFFVNQNVVVGMELFKGDTVFRPKDWAVRGTAVFNVNRLALDSFSPGELENKAESSLNKTGIEEAFVEKQLATFRPTFDVVSLRAGLQNFTSDFRGYVFSDNQLGLRLFGNAGGNRHQYNLAFFPMRIRDDATQLHSFDSREQNVLVANWFIQDFMTLGYTFLVNVHYSSDDGFPDGIEDSNGKLVKSDPGKVTTTYLGVHGDGKWGSFNVSHALYAVIGTDDANRVSGKAEDISAQMAALELSKDSDWKRLRLSLFYASGDDDVADGKAKGFDGIMDNPNLAGGAFMFWTQQASKNAAGNKIAVLSDKFSLLPNLRSKFTNRQTFVNPGLLLANAGIDLRVSPKLKVVTNASYLRFAKAELLQQIAQDPEITTTIGIDLGFGFKWRPLLNENFFLVGGVSALLPRGGYQRLIGGSDTLFSAFTALQLAY